MTRKTGCQDMAEKSAGRAVGETEDGTDRNEKERQAEVRENTPAPDVRQCLPETRGWNSKTVI